MSIIHLQQMRYRWHDQAPWLLAIDDFQAVPGEQILLQGTSGSGKTTLLAVLAGLLTPQQGQVCILNNHLETMRSAQRDQFRATHIGVIFQLFNLIDYLSVLDNVLLPLRFSAERRARLPQPAKEARRLLNALGLDASKLSSMVRDLSVGQQQRVAAARALLGRPALLLADEPTSALDSDNRDAFLNLLFQECQAAQTTVLCVSHDASLANHFHRHVHISEFTP